MASNCVSCKGRGMCGRPVCPVLERFKALGRSPKLSDNIFGASPPSVFVGRYGYPEVSAGPLVPPEVTGDAAAAYDNPGSWNNMSIEQIMGMRSTLVRSNIHFKVEDARTPDMMLQKTQELALSEIPVDTEVWFRKTPKLELRFDGVLSPMGPSGEVTRLDIAQNPVVPRKVDSMVSDTDVKASDAVWELYSSDITTDHITRIFSIGLLGRQRRIVPTRWSITATDDTIGKKLVEDIIFFPQVNDIMVYSGGLHGNHFEILVFPGAYNFELIEIWMPRAVWSDESTYIESDREDHRGKKQYSNLGGGYYAARLAVLEQLHRMKRCGSILAIREITPEYWAPLGVWVVREAARQTMASIPVTFAALEEAISDMSNRLNTSTSMWKVKSGLLDKRANQKTLAEFL